MIELNAERIKGVQGRLNIRTVPTYTNDDDEF